MIEKVKVRREIAAYELKLKEEIKNIERELARLGEMFGATNEMQKLWNGSTEKAVLTARYMALKEGLFMLSDLRCSEMLNG